MNDQDIAFWAELVNKGTNNAMNNLSQMVGQDIKVTSFGLRQIPVAETSQLMGGADVEAIGIYLTVSASALRNDEPMMFPSSPKAELSISPRACVVPSGWPISRSTKP